MQVRVILQIHTGGCLVFFFEKKKKVWAKWKYFNTIVHSNLPGPTCTCTHNIMTWTYMYQIRKQIIIRTSCMQKIRNVHAKISQKIIAHYFFQNTNLKSSQYLCVNQTNAKDSWIKIHKIHRDFMIIRNKEDTCTVRNCCCFSTKPHNQAIHHKLSIQKYKKSVSVTKSNENKFNIFCMCSWYPNTVKREIFVALKSRDRNTLTF